MSLCIHTLINIKILIMCRNIVCNIMSLTDTCGSQVNHNLNIIILDFLHDDLILTCSYTFIIYIKHYKIMLNDNQQVQSLPITCTNIVWVLLHP